MKTLIQLTKINKRYGSLEIFDDAGATLSENQKIGVIGRNGAGKTTLCRIITGEEEPDSGDVSLSSDLRLSYLEQNDSFNQDETVLHYLMRYTKKEEWLCGKIAAKFQLKNELLTSTRIGDLSGGYQTRIKLAVMLLTEPNFLVLDEPSNYLDLRTLILLEKFLQDFSGGFIIVSHDREFLKKTCKLTLEVEHGRLTLYPGTVEDYLEYKEEQKEQAELYNKNIELKQKQLQSFIERFRAKATKASQAQSKMKLMDKLKKIEIEHPISTVRIKIPIEDTKKGDALHCKDLSIGYPSKLVARKIYLEVERGSHIAVLGDNGQGKTTFLRTLAGELSPRDGDYQWGYGLNIAYYAQHVYASLNNKYDTYTYLQGKASTEVTNQEILNMAGCFLFRGDDIYKSVSVLSGGERARLCLAGLLLSKKTVLLLDEPTNHLDFETVEALGNALRDFGGTVFFISHDRTFVNLVATGIIEIKDGSVSLYPDTYENYVYHLENTLKEGNTNSITNGEKIESTGELVKKKTSYQLRKELNSEITKLKNKIKKVEHQIALYETEKQAIIDDFSNNSQTYSQEKSLRLEQLEQILKHEESIWIELQERMEELKNQEREILSAGK